MEKFLQGWRKNRRAYTGPKVSHRVWWLFDWQLLLRSVSFLSPIAQAMPNQLAVVAPDPSPQSTFLVLVNPAVFVETLGRRSNKAYLKLCGDGTFRFMESGWIMLNISVLDCHYSPVNGTYAF